MALKIGFANKFFTLWDVSSEDQFTTSPSGQHYLSHVKHNFQYIQNLSMDETSAIEKAKSMGCSSLTPDDELRGKSKSFSSEENIPIPGDLFQMGKYKWDKISECGDLKYLKFYQTETGCKLSALRICELDPSMVMFEGNLISIDVLERQEIIKGIFDGSIPVIAHSNFKNYSYLNVKIQDPQGDSQEAFNAFFDWGFNVVFKEDAITALNLKSRCFRGSEYQVPAGMKSYKGTVINARDLDHNFYR